MLMYNSYFVPMGIFIQAYIYSDILVNTVYKILFEISLLAGLATRFGRQTVHAGAFIQAAYGMHLHTCCAQVYCTTIYGQFCTCKYNLYCVRFITRCTVMFG
jgi:hypothetical protein